MEKSVAQLELEVREKAQEDAAVLRVGELISDPMVPEEVKNTAALMMLSSMINQFMRSPTGREVTAKWEAIQIPLMESLRFEGSTVETYNPETDNLSGAYLLFLTGPYTVIIDAEDVESMEDIKKRGYLVVKISKIRAVEDDDQDQSEEIDVIADGCILNIETGQAVCQALKDGNEAEAVSLIKTYQELVALGLIIPTDE